jgi:hypothetical protein
MIDETISQNIKFICLQPSIHCPMQLINNEILEFLSHLQRVGQTLHGDGSAKTLCDVTSGVDGDGKRVPEGNKFNF